MAVVVPTNTKPQRGVIKSVWSTMASTDTATAATVARYADKTVQFTGTFGAGTVGLQGSNDGSNFIALVDPQGNAIAASTGGKIEALLENPLEIKPVITTAATGMSVTVTVIGHRG